MIIPTGVDPSFFRKMEPKEALRRKWELPDDAFIILTVSNLETHKGVDVAIRALSLVSQNRADLVKLLVVGTGPQKSKLDQLITDLNLTDRVSFLGELDHWKIRELYSSADLFILSSWNEGLPFALLEAMSCECISVTSPVGDIPRVIEDGRNGFLVNAIRPEEFAEKINMIRSMERHGAESIREQAKRTVVEKFDLATSATRMLEAVERSVE
jgi:glycosyltransferase involved in cell wall biosynthesis